MNAADFDEEAAIGNYHVDKVYQSDFKSGDGKFIWIVLDEAEPTVEFHPPFPRRNRIKVTAKFVKKNSELTEVVLRKFKEVKSRNTVIWKEQTFGPSEPLRLAHLTFEKVREFLECLVEHDVSKLNYKRSLLVGDVGPRLDRELLPKLRQMLSEQEGVKMLDELLRDGVIESHDLVNIGFRKRQLETFKAMLATPSARERYRERVGIQSAQPEKIWQSFFEANQWIFGFGLDYRFLSILQREAHIGTDDLAGRDGPVSDFLLGASNFTVLVELKTPETPLFDSRKNRAGSWRLSSSLIDSVSQILEQKAAWQVKAERQSFTRSGDKIVHKTIDPKCILIIGSDNQFEGTDKEAEIKLRTFELFRRDSRNVEILTYDEVRNRAEFIVGKGQP